MAATPSQPLAAQTKAVAAIDTLRCELGLTVPELAALIERDRTHLWRVLAGQVTATPEIIGRCLIALGRVARDRERKAS